MRLFYEDKLEILQCELGERETELNQLQKDLLTAEELNSTTQEELQNQLRQKQDQVEGLKKMQSNYRKQSNQGPRSSLEIVRLVQLKHDVTKMKKRKVEMQKELANEKKNRMKEVNILQKVVVQKDREINKIQKISNQRSIDAETAKAMSKTRLEELTQLKKALRLYKRGVGLDPVLVGRRQLRTNSTGVGKRTSDDTSTSPPSIDFDAIRDYFDEKVASVARKEALVDKLAKEWEEYFELNNQLKERNCVPDEFYPSDREALEVQIQFKNGKIRKLAQRVKKHELPNVNVDSDSLAPAQLDAFLFDKRFSNLCAGT